MYRRLPRLCGWIIPIVATIAHPSLETVTLSVHIADVKDIDTLELSALETLFLNQPLSNNSTKLRFRTFCQCTTTDRSTEK